MIYNGYMMNDQTPNDWQPPQGAPVTILGGSGPFTNTWGYDPCDYASWPYSWDGPDDMQFEPLTLERAADLDLFELIAEVNRYDDDGPSEHRTFDMALRFFLHITNDPTYNGAFDPRRCDLSHSDIFAACLDTALIWERG
jgi:hypothetical protein